ncbi:MAG: ACT domain-containing protein [Butyrivibrio sp.]|nr:ACT domain-containing protein [Butyrivibrio sp.]
MRLKKIDENLTVCKINNSSAIDLNMDFYSLTKTADEISLVCKTENAPTETIKREDGWKGFKIQGELDFSLIGILSPIAKLLADNSIGIFVVSTYNTDYILVKKEKYEQALSLLENAGYRIS